MTLELGSGIGMIQQTIPECITSDIFENPFVDRIEDAYALSFEAASVSNLILFDVWHHLEYPGTALQEFARVLAPGGRVILFEPAALSLLGRFVFGFLHHEPIHAPKDLSWQLPEDQNCGDLAYYAAQGNAWKMFRKGEIPDSVASEWNVLEIAYFPAFDWLASGGFRGKQLCPPFLSGPLRFASRIAAHCPALFSTRMLVTLELNP
jgi:SAM-dependent methyltransferase